MNRPATPLEAGAAPDRRRVAFRVTPEMLPGAVRIVDATMILLAGLIATLIDPPADVAARNAAFSVAFMAVCFLLLAQQARLYHVDAVMRPLQSADAVLIAAGTAFLFLFSILFVFDAMDADDHRWNGYFVGLTMALAIGARFGLGAAVNRMGRLQMFGQCVVLLGTRKQTAKLLRRLNQNCPPFMAVLGVFLVDGEHGGGQIEGHPVIGEADDLSGWVRENKVDNIVVAMPWSEDGRIGEAVAALSELPVGVYLGAELLDFDLAVRHAADNFGGLPLFEVVQRPISGWSAALKAIEDYTLASILLLLLLPLFVVVAIALKLDTPGPIFFRQRRVGLNNRVFRIYKFRSMYHAPQPETVVRQASRNDPRVTRVGRFIRATSIDEIPQLLNVLNGTMSLVGPRPHAVSHNEEYGRLIPGYFARHRVKPGITGWAQVNGLRGETDTIDKMRDRVRHDVYYADNWSLFFDIKILILTGLLVFFQRNAY